MEVDEMKKMLRGGGQNGEGERVLLSSGSALLNLACSGDVKGAFAAGHYHFFCGDSQCGKTWLGMSAFAEAVRDSRFDDYRLIYDSAEEGALMDVGRFFGEKAEKRIEWLNPPSFTVEEFYYHVDDAFKKGVPFVYVLDSQDSLSSGAEQKKFDKMKVTARRKKGARRSEEEKGKGSYGDSKAKLHSAMLRTLMRPLKESGSILLILNQTRDSFDPFNPKSYSGGRALLFYATLQLWGSVGKKVEKQIRGKQRQLGTNAKVVVKKNRMSGRQRMVTFPILHDHGIDDVGSMVSYMVSEREWKETGDGNNKKIVTSGLGPEFSGKMDAVVGKIEEEEQVDDLKLLVQRTWDAVEAACVVKRRKRYE